MSLELRFCTIISNDGITIFHRTFVEDELDEYLFSGFSSAMIAFSRELGDSLSMIKMSKQTIFYHEATEDGFLILSFTKGYDIDEVQDKLYRLKERDSLNLLLAGSRIGLVQNENEKFERDLSEIFDVKTSFHETAEILEAEQPDHHFPDTPEMDIPRTNKKVKSLEEQLAEEADQLEQYLDAEIKVSKSQEEELSEFLDAFE